MPPKMPHTPRPAPTAPASQWTHVQKERLEQFRAYRNNISQTNRAEFIDLLKARHDVLAAQGPGLGRQGGKD